MKPSSKFLKLGQVIDALLNEEENENESESDDDDDDDDFEINRVQVSNKNTAQIVQIVPSKNKQDLTFSFGTNNSRDLGNKIEHDESSKDSDDLPLSKLKTSKTLTLPSFDENSRDSDDIPLAVLKSKLTACHDETSNGSDDVPLSKIKTKLKSAVVSLHDESSKDSDDIPLSNLLMKTRENSMKYIPDPNDDENDEEDEQLISSRRHSKVRRIICSSDEDEDEIPLSKLKIQSNQLHNKGTESSLTKKIKMKLIKSSSFLREKQQRSSIFLKGLYEFETFNDTIGVDPNVSLVYSDLDDTTCHESDTFNASNNDVFKFDQIDDKENMRPGMFNTCNKSPILALETSNKFTLALKNLKRKKN